MIDKETVGAIQEALVPVAEKIGEGVGMAWDLLVWGQFAEGLAGLIVSSVAIISSFFISYKLCIKGYELVGKRDDDIPSALIMGGVIVGFLGLLTVLWTNWTWLFIQIIAPEYATFKYLLTLVN